MTLIYDSEEDYDPNGSYRYCIPVNEEFLQPTTPEDFETAPEENVEPIPVCLSSSISQIELEFPPSLEDLPQQDLLVPTSPRRAPRPSDDLLQEIDNDLPLMRAAGVVVATYHEDLDVLRPEGVVLVPVVTYPEAVANDPPPRYREREQLSSDEEEGFSPASSLGSLPY